MKHVKHFNQQYSNLCAILGDLTIKQTKITKEIQDITNKIKALEASKPMMDELERTITKELYAELTSIEKGAIK